MRSGRKITYNRNEIIHNNRFYKKKLEQRGLKEDLKRAKIFTKTEKYIEHLEKENKELKKKYKSKKDTLDKIINSTKGKKQQSFL